MEAEQRHKSGERRQTRRSKSWTRAGGSLTELGRAAVRGVRLCGASQQERAGPGAGRGTTPAGRGAETPSAQKVRVKRHFLK